jgi:hypothetical protein
VPLALAMSPVHADWYLYLEAGSLQPTNAAQLGATIDTALNPITANRTFLAPDIHSQLTPRIGLGFDAGKGVVGFSYWGFSGDDMVSAGLDANGIPAIIVNASMAGDEFAPETGNVSVMGELEAWTIDLAYCVEQNPTGANLHTYYSFGITAVSFEDTVLLEADGDDDSGGYLTSLDEEYNLDFSGFGFSIGGGAEYFVKDNLSLYGNILARFVMGDTDEMLYNTDTYPPDTFYETVTDNRDSSGVIWDFAVGSKLYRSEKLQIGLEYQMSSWNSLVQRTTLGAEETYRPHFASRESVIFHGIALTALMKF